MKLPLVKTVRMAKGNFPSFKFSCGKWRLWAHDTGLAELVDGKGNFVYFRTAADTQAILLLLREFARLKLRKMKRGK